VSSDQQTARINVTDAEWLEFRTLAMHRRRSLADYLGKLVRAEIGHADRHSSDHAVQLGPPSGGAPRKNPVRLADQHVLTQFPGTTK
jgi:hypothetical protein